MTDKQLRASEVNGNGAILRLFGVILLSLGALNSMLMWRGGLAHGVFPAALLGAGILFYALGAIRRRRQWEGARHDV